MHRRRPQLHEGDVCRLSKKGRTMYPGLKMLKPTFIVNSRLPKDNANAWDMIHCLMVYSSNGVVVTRPKVLRRQYLWFTGHNRGQVPQHNALQYKAPQPDRACACDMELIMSRGCICGGI